MSPALLALLGPWACGFSTTYFQGEVQIRLSPGDGEVHEWSLRGAASEDTALVEGSFTIPCAGGEDVQLVTNDIRLWESDERLERLDESRRDPQILLGACADQLRLSARTHSPRYGEPMAAGQPEIEFHAEFAENPEDAVVSLAMMPDAQGSVEHTDALSGHLEYSGLLVDPPRAEPGWVEATWTFEPRPRDRNLLLGP